MKKIFSIMLGLAMAMGVNAQTENPNRLIMMSKVGTRLMLLTRSTLSISLRKRVRFVPTLSSLSM